MSGERRKPKPSGSTSSVPSPKMLSPFFACVLQQREDQVVLAHAVRAFDLVRVRDVDQFGDVLGFEFGEVHGRAGTAGTAVRPGGRSGTRRGAAMDGRHPEDALGPAQRSADCAADSSAPVSQLRSVQASGALSKVSAFRYCCQGTRSAAISTARRPCVASTLPSLNSISVGMPRMPNLAGVA